MRTLLSLILLAAGAGTLHAAKNLEIYCIDVEGGQATLLVPPGGESLLIDTGWPGFNHRDSGRILAAAKAAGVKKIDYLVITHYHTDHVGGVPQLAEKMPIRNFVDHGDSIETGRDAKILFSAYSEQRGKGKHILVKPGDTIPVKGLNVHVLSAAGEVIGSALPGAGQPNPECAASTRPSPDKTENGQSIGLLITFGEFRMLDLGDLTRDREYGLVCPNHKIGTVDFYLAGSHGSTDSSLPALVRALHPRAAIVDNGPRKGGSAEVWQTIHDSPGLEDLWQLHFAVAAGKDHNSADTYIANVDEICEAKWLKVSAQKDGAFTIYNARNKFEKTYQRK